MRVSVDGSLAAEAAPPRSVAAADGPTAVSPPSRDDRPASHRVVPWRIVWFGVLLAAYVVLILGVIHRSPLLRLDTDVLRLDLREHHPSWFPAVNTYVMLGQRAPSTLAALPWLLWRSWRTRSVHGLVTLVTALLALNVSVGAVKIWIGRLGPLATHHVFTPFEGGNIFPSGHVSNAVVLYGVLAMLASRWRRTAAVLAVVVSVTVGLCTLYLDTHWFTDVLGGWFAGSLVLLVLPTLTRWVETLLAHGWLRWRGTPTTWLPPVRRPPTHALPSRRTLRRGGPGRPGSAPVVPQAVDAQGNETPVSSSDLVQS